MSAETNDLNALIGRALDQLSGEDVIRPTRVATVVMEWLDPMSVARRRAQTRSAARRPKGAGSGRRRPSVSVPPITFRAPRGSGEGLAAGLAGGRIPVGPVALAVLLGISK